MSATTWAVVAGLGFYHGLNPAMGWLFAAAHGFQEGRASAVLRALPPIAAGHTLSVGVVIALVASAGAIVPAQALRVSGAAVLLIFAAYLLTRRVRHVRRIGMRAGARDLVLWSFIMTSAHGSGLMLMPVLLRAAANTPAGTHAAHLHAGVDGSALGSGWLVLAIHTTAMLGTLAAAALLSYRVLGVAFLRRAWINLDVIWMAALVLAAVATLLTG
jgi:hypothetical protein